MKDTLERFITRYFTIIQPSRTKSFVLSHMDSTDKVRVLQKDGVGREHLPDSVFLQVDTLDGGECDRKTIISAHLIVPNPDVSQAVIPKLLNCYEGNKQPSALITENSQRQMFWQCRAYCVRQELLPFQQQKHPLASACLWHPSTHEEFKYDLIFNGYSYNAFGSTMSDLVETRINLEQLMHPLILLTETTFNSIDKFATSINTKAVSLFDPSDPVGFAELMYKHLTTSICKTVELLYDSKEDVDSGFSHSMLTSCLDIGTRAGYLELQPRQATDSSRGKISGGITCYGFKTTWDTADAFDAIERSFHDEELKTEQKTRCTTINSIVSFLRETEEPDRLVRCSWR